MRVRWRSAGLFLIAGCMHVSAFAAGKSEAAYTALDHRLSIVLSAPERNQVLYAMRELLHGMHNIHVALSKGDLGAVAVEARPMGQLLDRFPETVRKRLPASFLVLGEGLGASLGRIATLAENREPVSALHAEMADLFTYCSGCHDTYRLDAAGAGSWR